MELDEVAAVPRRIEERKHRRIAIRGVGERDHRRAADLAATLHEPVADVTRAFAAHRFLQRGIRQERIEIGERRCLVDDVVRDHAAGV
jgi:hypothetical protein